MENAVQTIEGVGQLTVRTGVGSDRVETAFQDTGPGIQPETQGKIFEPLFTTKTRGVGLGLAICKHIVEAHRGRIWFETELGVGTTFVVGIPVAGEAQAAGAAKDPGPL